jgi:hypothetical protein
VSIGRERLRRRFQNLQLPAVRCRLSPKAKPALPPVSVARITAFVMCLVPGSVPATAQPSQTGGADPAATIATWLAGDFSNEAQAPLTGITPGGSDRQEQDRLFAQVRRAAAPELPGVVLYVQWNRDRRNGPIARQRLWVVMPGAGDEVARLRVLAFRDPEPYVDALESPEVLRTITSEDLAPVADDCELGFVHTGQAYLGTTRPSCATEASGRTLTLQIRLRVSASGFAYSEATYTRPDLEPFVTTPRKGSYEFVRVKR